MATLRNRIADLEQVRLPCKVDIVHLVIARSEAEEAAETARLAREAPNAEAVSVRLMRPGFPGWPTAAAEYDARRATRQ